MKITVTRNDIRNGVVSDGGQCPVARAIRRVTHARAITVGDTTITVRGEAFSAPKSVTRFVHRFDDMGTKSVKPFSFSLPLPVTKRSTKKTLVLV